VFLFDEPLSNLDAKLRVQMRVEIKALHQRLRTTTIYVTHDQIEAMTMADKIVVLRDGVVEQIGRPLALYDEPANIFVAQFIGSPAMNILAGTVNAQGVQHGDVVLPLPDGLRQRAAGLADVQYGIRPEHLVLAETGLPVAVDVVEPTGSDTVIFGRLGDTPIVVNIRDRVDIAAGTSIFVQPLLDKIHLFDAATTRRV
jgi:multiple sugar transport system ATP-binding protein